MRIKQTCKICKKPFIAIKVTQRFCKRECFKRDYYLRIKEKLQKLALHPNYPQKQCSFCSNTVTLPFDPIKSPNLFNDFRCPFCNVPNNMIWQYSALSGSHEMILNILISNKLTQPETHKFEVFTLSHK